MDGEGKYQLFQAGAVLLHPSTARSGCMGEFTNVIANCGVKKGALGYPTSDEKSQSNSVDRVNAFQHGKFD